MIRLLPFCTAVVLAAAAPAAAQSPFDGTWKSDLSAASVTARPNEFQIKDGTYSCASCLPAAYSVKADGAFHAVKDRPYWDAVSVSVVDDHTIAYQFRKGGKVIARNTQAVSPDGNTLSVKGVATANGAGTPIETAAVLTRAGPAPAGAHAASGQWKAAPAASVSDAALTFTLRIDGDMLHLKSPGMAESLDAKFGGPFVVNAGDPGKTMTKAERLSATAIRLTDMQLGKVTQVSTYTVAPDGASITGDWTDPRDGAKGTFVARKQ
ncbi:hypothetical protein [Sphingomonas sp.]|uniref:hypothetical protein n=1 Tax=Sphingomonas sp. TaxID=28214 RepID=UPI0035BC5505